MEDDLNILELEYLSNHCMDCDWILRVKLEEISSVALLSPACLTFFASLILY